jgi:8-oxo-dGTP pyrophosphatase MutT (NUDIX family)
VARFAQGTLIFAVSIGYLMQLSLKLFGVETEKRMPERIHVKHRPTARVLLVNSAREYLLIKTHFDPELGLPPRWLTPGGGVDAGETVKQAAVRELKEETGLEITEADLGEVFLELSGRWDWSDGIHYQTYTDTIFWLPIENFELTNSGWTEDEHRDVPDWRWWKLQRADCFGRKRRSSRIAEQPGSASVFHR